MIMTFKCSVYTHVHDSHILFHSNMQVSVISMSSILTTSCQCVKQRRVTRSSLISWQMSSQMKLIASSTKINNYASIMTIFMLQHNTVSCIIIHYYIHKLNLLRNVLILHQHREGILYQLVAWDYSSKHQILF